MSDDFYNPPGTTMLPIAELVDQAWYEGVCRNTRAARWSSADQRFHYLRYKFGGLGSPSVIQHLADPELPSANDGFSPHRRMTDEEAQEQTRRWAENDAKLEAARNAPDDHDDD